MTHVAVTGAASPLGAALLARLDADPDVARILGIDLIEPGMPVASLEFRVADPRDPVLSRALDGADVIIHLAGWVGEATGEDVGFARTVHGTRNVLESAARVGASRIVHLSTAMVYGAHADNPVPLGEHARLRANADVAAGYHALLAEELVADFADAHPEVSVAVLRPATVLGDGIDSWVTRLLEAFRIPAVAGYEPPFQFVDVEDVAAAAHLLGIRGGTGAFNVAPDGWLPAAEVVRLLGRRPVQLPETPALGAAALLHRLTGSELSEGELAYLMHPWVVSNARLRAAGWRAERSNRDVWKAAVEAHRPWMRMGSVRVRRRDLYAGAGAAGVALTGAAVWAARHR